jgi:hypothetical protein
MSRERTKGAKISKKKREEEEEEEENSILNA